MFHNRTFKVLSNLILLVVFCTGQAAAAPSAGASSEPATSIQSTEGGTINLETIATTSSSPALTWNTFLGSSSWDQPHKILTDQNGNIILIGESVSNWGNPIIPHSEVLDDYDVFVAKLDQNGNLIWNTFLGGAAGDEIQDVAIDKNGVIYIMGLSYAGWGNPIAPHHGGNQKDAFVAKIDNNGNLSWNTFFGYATGSDYPTKISLSNTGEIYIAGATASSYYSYGCGYWGTPINETGCTFIAKLDTTGHLLWNTFLGGDSNRWDGFSAFTIDSNGYIYIAVSGGYGCDMYGCTFKEFIAKLDSNGNLLWTLFPNGNVYDEVGISDMSVDNTTGSVYFLGVSRFGWGNPVNPHSGDYDSLVGKIDQSGNLLWYTFLGGTGYDSGSHIFIDAIENIYIDGSSESNWGEPIVPYQDSISNPNPFVAKLGKNGNLLWNTFPGGIGWDQISDMALADDGKVYITGTSDQTWGNPTNPFQVNTPSFVAELNSDGALQWNTFAGTGSVDLAIDANKNIFVTGQSYDSWGTPIIPLAGGFDVYAAKISPIVPPEVSSYLSTVTISPASIPADGVTSATVIITCMDTNSNPVPGKTVLLRSDRGGDDIIAQPLAPTDANGQTSGTISSLSSGTSQIYVVDVIDNVKLSQKPFIQFTENNPGLHQGINTLNHLSNNSLTDIAIYAKSAGEHGDYFRGAIIEDVGKATISALKLFTGTVAGVNEIDRLKGGVQLALPGLEDYKIAKGFLSEYPQSGDLFNFTVREAIKTGNYRGLTQSVLNAGFRYYAAKYLRTRVEDLTDDAVINAWKNIYSSGGGFTEVGNWLGSDINNIKSGLNDLSNLPTPQMSAGQQSAYIEDLNKRSRVPQVISNITLDRIHLLENVRDAHESNAWSGNFNLKFLADALASTLYDGYGHIMVNDLTEGFELYLSIRKYNLDNYAFALVPTILKSSVESTTFIYDNEATGLDRINRLLPPLPVTGQITAVRNYSHGQFKGPIYFEDGSFSEIDIKNTSTSEIGTFEVIAQYGYNTTIFKVPWAYLPMVKSKSILLAPGESQTVRIYYKEGGTGGSPDKNDSLNFNVLGSNSTGVFFIGHRLEYWNPQILTGGIGSWLKADFSSPAQSEVVSSSDIAIIENPISVYVNSDSTEQTYLAEIYVANPFSQAIDVNITQHLPAGVNILTTDGTLDGSTISWRKNVASNEIVLVTFTFSYPAGSGDALSLPAAEMSFVEPAGGQSVNILSNTPAFTRLSQLDVKGYAPVSIPNVESDMSITVSNLSGVSKNGTIDITLDDINGQIFAATSPFNVSNSGQQIVTFTLPGLSEGLYPVEVFITINGVKTRAFGDTYQVIPPLTVLSSIAASPNPTDAASVDFTVTFSEDVTGVDMIGPQFDDFALTTSSGISGASITSVSGAGTAYTVTVNTGSGNGTIRLDVPVTATITDLAGITSLSGLPFNSGESYTLRPFAPISRWTSSFDLSHGWTVKDFVRTVGDVNHDGNADLIGFGQDGMYVALSNGSNGFGAISKWTSSFDLSHGWTVADFVRTVGDVNHDNNADLIGFGQDGVYVALSDGSSSFGPISKWTSSFDLSHGWTVKDFVRTVGDVNHDGDADLIGFGQDGVYVALSNGSNGFGSISKWTSSFDLSHGWTVADFVRTVGDVNNDGDADLIGFGQDGVYVALSDSSTSFGPISKWTSSFDLSHGWTVADFVRTAGDVNNDGNADLIGFGQDGVYVALSNGSNGFGPISKWTSSFDLSHGWTVADFVRTMGDVNHDGKADLVGFGLDGVYVATAK